MGSRSAITVDEVTHLMIKRMAVLEGKGANDLVRDMIKSRLAIYPDFKRQAVLDGIQAKGA